MFSTHDDMHHSAEINAYKACEGLVLWVQTIAPIESSKAEIGLFTLAKVMNWPTYICPETGCTLISPNFNTPTEKKPL